MVQLHFNGRPLARTNALDAHPAPRPPFSASNAPAIERNFGLLMDAIGRATGPDEIHPELKSLRELIAADYLALHRVAAGAPQPKLEDLLRCPDSSYVARGSRLDVAKRLAQVMIGPSKFNAHGRAPQASAKETITAQMPPPLTLPITFFLGYLDRLGSFVSKAEWKLLKNYYSPGGLPNLYCLNKSLEKLLRVAPDELARLASIIDRLRGGGNGSLADAPLVSGPITVTVTAGELVASSVVSLIRFFQRDPRQLRGYLAEAQRLTEHSPIKRITVMIEGPLSSQDLHDLYDQGPNAIPLPAVRVCYRLPLPSGGFAELLLKAEAGPNAFICKRGLQYSAEDAKIVTGFLRLLRNPAARDQLAAEAAPLDIGECERSNESLDSTLRPHRLHWALPLWQRALDAESSQPGRIKPIGISQELLGDPVAFKEAVRTIARNLPAYFPHRPRRQLECSPQRLERFLLERTPVIQKIMQNVLDRDNNCDSTRDSQRSALSYRGPHGGIPLSLPMVTFDHFIDFNKVENYKLVHGRDASVPEERRRLLDGSQRFYRIEDLPALLTQVPMTRTVQAVIADPSTPRGHYVLFGREAMRAGFAVGEENYARARKILGDLERSLIGRVQLGLQDMRKINTLQVAFSTAKELDRSIAACTKRIELHRGQMAEAANLASRRTDISREDRKQFVAKAKLPYQRLQAQEELHLAELQMRYAELVSMLPDNRAVPWMAKVLFISDQQALNLIFGIGESRKGVYELDGLGKDGFVRVTHSQLLGCEPAFAAGGKTLGYYRRVFLTFRDWVAFDEQIQINPPRKLKCLELNNGSGHYQPPAHLTLEYAANELFPALEAIGIDTSECELKDLLAPGAQLRSI